MTKRYETFNDLLNDMHSVITKDAYRKGRGRPKKNKEIKKSDLKTDINKWFEALNKNNKTFDTRVKAYFGDKDFNYADDFAKRMFNDISSSDLAQIPNIKEYFDKINPEKHEKNLEPKKGIYNLKEYYKEQAPYIQSLTKNDSAFDNIVKTELKNYIEKQNKEAEQIAENAVPKNTTMPLNNKKLLDNLWDRTKTAAKKVWRKAKSTSASVNSAVTTGPLMGMGLISGAVAYPLMRIGGKIVMSPEEYENHSFLNDAFGADGWNHIMALAYDMDENIRNWGNAPKYEDMDRTEKIIDLASNFVGPAAPMNAGKGLKNLFGNFVQGTFMPGLQLTKGAKIGTKMLESLPQVGIPAALGESVSSITETPGIFFDYSKQNEENTEEDPEKILLAQRIDAKPENIEQVELQNNKKDEKTSIGKKAAKVLAPLAIAGGVFYGRHNPKLQEKIRNFKNAKIDAKNSKVFEETLTSGDRFMHTIDMQSTIDKAEQTGFLSKNAAQSLRRNAYQQSRNYFNDVKVKSELYPEDYKKFNKLMENNYKLSSKMHELNKKLGKAYTENGLTIQNFLDNPAKAKTIGLDDNFSIADYINFQKKLYKEVLNSPFKSTLQQISNFNNQTIDIGVATGAYDPIFGEYLRRNRTFGGLNTYLPGIYEQTDQKWWNKLLNFYNNITSSKNNYVDPDIIPTNTRSDNFAVHIAPWDQTAESNIINTHKKFLENKQKYDLVQDLLERQTTKIKNSINEINTLNDELKTVDVFSKGPIENKILDRQKDVLDEFTNIRYVGKRNLLAQKEFNNDNPLLSILNKTEPNAPVTEGEALMNKKLNDTIKNSDIKSTLDAIQQANTNSKIIRIIHNNDELYYETSNFFGDLVYKDPQAAGYIQTMFQYTNDWMKSFITGKFNPFFGYKTGAYTATDIGIGLRSINKELSTNVTRQAFSNEFNKAYKDLRDYKINARKIDRLHRKYLNNNITPNERKELATLIKQQQQSDITQIRAAGASLQGKYPTGLYKNRYANPEKTYTINSFKTLNKLKNRMLKTKFLNDMNDHTMNGIDNAYYVLQTLRDAPQLAYYRAFKNYFTKADGKIDVNAIMDFSRMLDKHTAAGTNMIAPTRLGKGLRKYLYDPLPYFSDMMSENIARARQLGIKGIQSTFTDLFDQNVPIQQTLKRIGKGITTNDFVVAGSQMLAAPLALAVGWNNANEDNRKYYDALPDSFKNSGIVLANIDGHGHNIVIPLTQSLMWIYRPMYHLIQGAYSGKFENDYNNQENLGTIMGDVAKLNFGFNMPPVFNTLVAAGGYRLPQINELVENAHDADYALDNYKLRSVNKKSDTYYRKGLFDNETRQMVRTNFGNLGDAVMEGIDQASRYSQGDSTKSRIAASMLGTATKSLTNAIMPAKSAFNDTSKQIYDKKELYDKYKKNINDEETGQRQISDADYRIYKTITEFKRTQIEPLTDLIDNIKQDINILKNTGRLKQQNVPYYKQSDTINDLTMKINRLQSEVMKRYEKMDKLLLQEYNTTFNNFMRGIK